MLGGYIYEAYFECHVILILGKCLIKAGRHRPDMTIAVDWDVKHHFKQTNKASAWFWYTDSALFLSRMKRKNRRHRLYTMKLTNPNQTQAGTYITEML